MEKQMKMSQRSPIKYTSISSSLTLFRFCQQAISTTATTFPLESREPCGPTWANSFDVEKVSASRNFWGSYIWKMLPLTLLIGVSMWGSRIDAYRIGKFNQTTDNRSGGYPKFAQSFSSSANKFIHEFYKFSNNNLERNRPIYSRNACGIRTINYSPKRTGRIIGGRYCTLSPVVFVCSSYSKRIESWWQFLYHLGHAAPYGAFPWQVEIQIFNYEKGIYEHHCGAAVIGELKLISNLEHLQLK